MVTDGGVIVCRCEKTGKMYGMTMLKYGSGKEAYWEHHWTFALDEKAAGREGYSSAFTIKGDIRWSKKWPGCPYCGNGGYFNCGSCGKMNCYSDKPVAKCQWCKTDCTISGTIESLDVGGGF